MTDDRCDLLCLDLPQAETLRQRCLDPEAAARLAGRARALADPTRLMLVAALRDADELCVCDLSWISERAENLVSHHLKTLRSDYYPGVPLSIFNGRRTRSLCGSLASTAPLRRSVTGKNPIR